MEEIWKDIPGYEGLYKVSNLGRVKSFIIHNGTNTRILKPRKVKDGYLMVALYNNKKRKNFQIHQLVAQMFIPNINNYTEVNHKDLNKSNNSVTNLEWLNHHENILHYYKERRFA